MEIIKNIIGSVLIALYEPFGFALLMSILFMFVYLYAKEKGWKVVVKLWLEEMRTNSKFCRVFILVFYVAMILFKTLLNRQLWMSPLANVIGVWGLYNENGDLTTEAIENLALFIPFIILLLWCFREKMVGESTKFLTTLWKSVFTVFIFSLTIEFAQLFFRLGTFQISDLFYNTLGGFLGGLFFWCGYKIINRMKSQ